MNGNLRKILEQVKAWDKPIKDISLKPSYKVNIERKTYERHLRY